MNIMVSELYDALMSAGAEEGKARRAAESSATSYEETGKQFAELREDNQKMRTEMAALRGDLRSEMQALRTEMAGFRGDLRSETTALRGESRSEMQVLRTEMAALRGDLRSEMQSLKGELSLVKWMGGILIGLAVAILIKVLFV